MWRGICGKIVLVIELPLRNGSGGYQRLGKIEGMEQECG
jgi:hypothetical protein